MSRCLITRIYRQKSQHTNSAFCLAENGKDLARRKVETENPLLTSEKEIPKEVSKIFQEKLQRLRKLLTQIYKNGRGEQKWEEKRKCSSKNPKEIQKRGNE